MEPLLYIYCSFRYSFLFTIIVAFSLKVNIGMEMYWEATELLALPFWKLRIAEHFYYYNNEMMNNFISSGQ